MTAIVSRDNTDKLTLHFKRVDTFEAVKNRNRKKASGILQLNKIYSFVLFFVLKTEKNQLRS